VCQNRRVVAYMWRRTREGRQVSLHRPLVAVEPVEDLFDHLVVRRRVSTIKHGVTFVLFRCSEKSEHRFLGRFQREDVIVSTVDHQDGHCHPGGEVDLVDFGRHLPEAKTTANQHTDLDPLFERQENIPEFCPRVHTVVGKFFVVEVFAGLYVVNRSSKVLRPRDEVVSIEQRRTFSNLLEPIVTFVMTFVDGANKCPAAFDDEVPAEQRKVRLDCRSRASVPGK